MLVHLPLKAWLTFAFQILNLLLIDNRKVAGMGNRVFLLSNGLLTREF